MTRLTSLSILVCALLGCSKPGVDESKYSGPLFTENIRTTPARSPEEERLGFKLPDGFEIQLFASEPDIQKPMNLAFDAKGRMWVTQSFDYPFPADRGKGTDHITILEDTDRDGKADKFTTFSDTLNIPIGIYPQADGAVAFSIPSIFRFTDSNNDGKADNLRKLIGPFGYVDTHGMVSNFYRGFDGWIHGCHGFTNDSWIAGSDGDSVHMISGNTYRFKMDGSRIEQTTFGQVNPFGLAYDEWGYVYSTDSHSSPLYQLITGGDYPHFAKQEIMAFGPDMKPFEDEATALCGIAYFGDVIFPPEFRGNFVIGDVINSRVQRYSYANQGSSPVGKSEEDFVKSEDPWFRPVNIKLGPDGAIYVADFYNKIIGHYEVPLGHPERDKSRGRIWRITYKGKTNEPVDLSSGSIDNLLKALDHDNLAVRFLATDEITDRFGQYVADHTKELVDRTTNWTPRQRVHLLWIAQRLGLLTVPQLATAATSRDELVRVHAMRIMQEGESSEACKGIAVNALSDSSAHVRRAAAEHLARYPEMGTVKAVLALLAGTPAEDTHLVYTGRLVLRNLLRNEKLMAEVLAASWTPSETAWIEGTLVDVYSEPAGLFLAKYMDQNPLPVTKRGLAYQQIGRFVGSKDVETIATKALNDLGKDIDERAAIFRGMRMGLAQRGSGEPSRFKEWGQGIAMELLKKYSASNEEASDETAEWQRLAFELTGDYQVKALRPQLKAFVMAGGKARNDTKVSALGALLKMEPAESIELAAAIILNDSLSLDLRRRAANTLSTFPGPAVNRALTPVKNVPPDIEAAVAVALASSQEGKKILFNKIKAGEIATRTLVNPRVRDRMLLQITPADQKQYDQLTANLSEVSKEKDQLIESRMAGFRAAKLTQAQIDSGALVYITYCTMCHRRVSKDGVGPPLAGISKRGAKAIVEKIIDPNRNITEAFRNYTVKTKDGKVINGVYRREEGKVAVYADITGTEILIPKADIVEAKLSPFTLMPETFGTSISQHELNKLIAYLLTY